MTTDAQLESVQATPPRYWGFISYSHRDEAHARWLHRALETYLIPKGLQITLADGTVVPARLHPIFRDREDLSSAPSLSDKLLQALRDSRCLIVVCSPAAAKSKWVNQEICYFKSLGRADKVFCLIVDGKPKGSLTDGMDDQECFPPAIRFQVTNEGVVTDQHAEPLAADARPEGDTRPGALLKLIAGILGIRLDDLRRREHVRQQRRRAIISALVASILVILSGFSLFSWMMWQRAEVARVAADNAKVKAMDAEAKERKAKEKAIEEKERAEKLTNRLIAYVSEIGTWFADKIGTKPEGLDDYKDFLAFNDEGLEDLTKLSPESEYARQLHAVFLIFSAHAHVRTLSDQENEYAAAREDIAKGVETLKPLHSHPEDPRWEARNALFHTNLALTQWALGDKEAALASAKHAVDIVDKIDFEPIPESRALAARVHSNYGDLLVQNNQLVESISSYRRSQKILEEAIKKSGDGIVTFLDLELHNVLISISHVQQQRKQPSLAFEALEEAKQHLALLENRPGYGAAWSLRLFWSEYAEVCFQLGNIPSARTALVEMERISQELVDLPRAELPREYREDSAKLQILLAQALEKRASLEVLAKSPTQAVAPLSRAVRICRILAIEHPSGQYHEDYILRSSQLIDLHESIGQWDELSSVAKEILAYCDGLPDTHPDLHRLFYFRGVTQWRLARAAWETGELRNALDHASAALNQFDSTDAKNSQAEMQAKFPMLRCALHTLIAQVFLAQNKPAEGMQAVQEALKFDSTNVDAHRWRAHALLFAGNTEEAKQAYLGQWTLKFFSAEYPKTVEQEFTQLRRAGSISPDVKEAMHQIELALKIRKP